MQTFARNTKLLAVILGAALSAPGCATDWFSSSSSSDYVAGELSQDVENLPDPNAPPKPQKETAIVSPLGATFKESPDRLLLQADAYFDQGKFHDSARLYRKYLATPEAALAPPTVLGKARYRIAVVARKKMDFAEAKREFEAAIRHEPRNPLYRFDLGKSCFDGADYAGADAAFSDLLATNPDYPQAQYYYGLTLLEGTRRAEALAPLTKAVGELEAAALLTDKYYAVGELETAAAWEAQTAQIAARLGRPVPAFPNKRVAPAQTAPAPQPQIPAQTAPAPQSQIPAQIAPAPQPQIPAQTAPAPQPQIPAQTAPAPQSQIPAQNAPAPQSQIPAQTAPALQPQIPAQIAPAPQPQTPAQNAPAPQPQIPAQTAPAPQPQIPTQTALAPQPQIPTQTAPAPQPQIPAQTAPAPQPQIPAQTAPAPQPQIPAQTAPAPQPQIPTQTAPAPQPQIPTQTAPAPQPQIPAQTAPAPQPQIPAQTAPAPQPQIPAQTAPTPQPQIPTQTAPVVASSLPPFAEETEPVSDVDADAPVEPSRPVASNAELAAPPTPLAVLDDVEPTCDAETDASATPELAENDPIPTAASENDAPTTCVGGRNPGLFASSSANPSPLVGFRPGSISAATEPLAQTAQINETAATAQDERLAFEPRLPEPSRFDVESAFRRVDAFLDLEDRIADFVAPLSPSYDAAPEPFPLADVEELYAEAPAPSDEDFDENDDFAFASSGTPRPAAAPAPLVGGFGSYQAPAFDAAPVAQEAPTPSFARDVVDALNSPLDEAPKSRYAAPRSTSTSQERLQAAIAAGAEVREISPEEYRRAVSVGLSGQAQPR